MRVFRNSMPPTATKVWGNALIWRSWDVYVDGTATPSENRNQCPFNFLMTIHPLIAGGD